MSKAVQIRKNGGPEEMEIVDVQVGEPGPGEIRIRHKAVGLNFIDVYHRTGVYPLPGGLPATPGMEGAGIVVAVADDVSEFRPGDRVAYAGMPPGAYAEERLIPAHRLVKLPAAISDPDGPMPSTRSTR